MCPVSLGRMTKAELRRRLVEVAAAAGFDSVPKAGSKRYKRLEKLAFDELLDAVWLRGQASAMGISITRREVIRERARLIAQAFRSRAEYHEFLAESHYTRRDVDERVEIQLLSSRIQRRIAAKEGNRGPEAFTEFVDAFKERWRARTVCAPEYATDRCSNGPPRGNATYRSRYTYVHFAACGGLADSLGCWQP